MFSSPPAPWHRFAASVAFWLAVCTSAHALDPQRHASALSVQSWSTRDGLPHNMVHAVAQDAAGYIWVATWEGVVRFDGRDFAVYDNSNIPGLMTRAFSALALDQHGDLLAGSTRQGVWRHDGTRWIAPTGRAAQIQVTTLLQARDGSLWIGNERGVDHVDAAGRLLLETNSDGRAHNLWAHALAETRDGRILMAADGGFYEDAGNRAQSGHVMAERGLPPGNARAILQRRDGTLWVATQNGVFQRNGDRYERVEVFGDRRIDALLEDRAGVVWANSSMDGLLRLAHGELETMGPEMGVTGRGTPALMEDREGLIWFGTTDGLFRVSDGPATTLDKRRGLSDDFVRSVLRGRDGTMWIGTSSGLDAWRGGRLEHVERADRDGHDSSVLALAETDAGIWAGTYDQGLVLLPRGTQAARRFDEAAGLPSRQVRALAPARDGGVWVGTVLGLMHGDGSGHFQSVGGDTDLGTGVVRALLEQPDGTLWAGTEQGMVRRDAQGRQRLYSRTSTPALPADVVFDFLADRDGTLWIGSDSGILRLRGERITRYGMRQGLPNESIFRILPGENGDLWFTSNRGVFRIPRAQFGEVDAGRRATLAVDVVDRGSGLRNPQANGNSSPAGAVADDGKLWVPTAAGVVVIDPAAMPTSAQARIPMVIESVLADGVEQGAHATIRLPAARAQRVVIRYAGLNFRHAGNLRYRYRMEGFDAGWIEAGSANEAVYTNLPPGSLRFRVQALVRPADWSAAARPDEASIAFDIAPPLHRTRWFQLLAALGLVALVVAALRFRDAALLRQRRRLQDEVAASTRELRGKNEALEHAAGERQSLLEQLDRQVRHDDLTGLPNRRALNAALALACAGGRSCQIALVDADHFKLINDTHGHEVGDEVLQHIARVMQEELDPRILCARWGGEEFALLVPDLTPEQALAACEELRARLAASPYRFADGRELQCTVSIGLSGCHRDAAPQQLLREADVQAYRAKAEGRNRVCAQVEHGA